MTDEAKKITPTISPDIYDEQYFCEVMPGKENYLKSHGREISNLYKIVLDLAGILPDMTVLDFGCGRGELVYQSVLKGAKTIGIDYSDAAIKLSNELMARLPDNLKGSVKIIKLSAGRLLLNNDSIDRILLIDVIEHLTDDEMNILLSEFYRVLKSGGKLIIHTPNRLHFDIGWKYYTYYAILLTRLLRLKNPKNVHRELRTDDEKKVHINEQEPFYLKKTLMKSGFKQNKIILKNVYEGHQIIRKYLGNMIYNLYPISLCWPLKFYFNHSLFGVAVK